MVVGKVGGFDVEIIVNNRAFTLSGGSTVTDLLEHMNSPKSVAVFVNGRQLLLAEYDKYVLEEKDNIRVIRPLGGG